MNFFLKGSKSKLKKKTFVCVWGELVIFFYKESKSKKKYLHFFFLRGVEEGGGLE